MVIDSHAHLYFDRFDEDRQEVIQRAREAGVRKIINVGTDVETSRQAIELARRHDGLFASVGLHPTSRVDDLDPSLDEITALAREFHQHVVAIGEFGLDYYWKDVNPEIQKERSRRQLTLARSLGLPVIFHCRDALGDLLSLLEAETDVPPGVFHCFSGGPKEARRALAMNFHISFAGNVTYPKAVELKEAAKEVPAERLLLETDSPFLAPQPRRGKRNEPAFVHYSRNYIAELKGIAPEEFGELAATTTEQLFGM